MRHTLSDNRHGLIASSDGDAISQQKRRLIKQGFGWAKLIGLIRQVMGTWVVESRPAIGADDGGLQPHAHAHPGANPSVEIPLTRVGILDLTANISAAY
jgi:hypothetical protein